MKVGQNFFAEQKEEKLSQEAIHDICHQHASSACEDFFLVVWRNFTSGTKVVIFVGKLHSFCVWKNCAFYVKTNLVANFACKKK